jgi:hypothetical protein
MAREVKRARGAAVSESSLLRLIEILESPSDILYDSLDPAVVYVFDSPGDQRKEKFIVRVGVEEDVAKPGGGKRRRKLNKVRSAGIVQNYNLADTKRYIPLL